MDVQAGQGGERASTSTVRTKKRTGELPVPFAEVTTIESIATGFRVDMFDLTDKDGTGGSVQTGSGFGSDFITLNWGDKKAIVRGVDLLRAWVATFDTEAVKQFPDGLS
jgi:hypothetical protein